MESEGATASLRGTLWVCPTPIGNLEDLTLRALRILREVQVIAAEDTRHTRKLLTRYGVSKPLVSYHSHNQVERAGELLARLSRGEDVALVSDAGTPGISDPGAVLVREALARGLPVVVLPGPSAVLTALVVSGLSTSRFVFEGFLPARQRRRSLNKLVNEERTIIFFEAPHRLLATLRDVLAVLGDRPVAVARELTKAHEEVFRGKVSAAVEHFQEKPVKGEITIVLAGQDAPKEVIEPEDTTVYAAVTQLMSEGMQKRAALKETARRYGMSSRKVYAVVERKKNDR
ncbi:MAG: 16S rRNA (cytidine(1402)-2'-O)-methyltransferase [Ammonifex sp.]|nr:MAG: 16S rRNA (cytidine(1402)-2'-O)-methyltransferase [Ammonifex sp.]